MTIRRSTRRGLPTVFCEPAACVQSRCAQVCGQPVQTRRRPCVQAGDSTEDKTGRSAYDTLVTSGNAVHRVCEEKTSCRQIVHTGRDVVHRRNVVMSLPAGVSRRSECARAPRAGPSKAPAAIASS